MKYIGIILLNILFFYRIVRHRIAPLTGCDADKHNQGMAISQVGMANAAMQELFEKISGQFPSAKMKSFGLPKKYDDGGYSGIHTNIYCSNLVYCK